jgi:hypothetical protein
MNFFRTALASLFVTALLALTGCSIDLTSGELDVSDDDDSAMEEGECQFLERFFADQDADGCLEWWEHDDTGADLWVSLMFCGYDEVGNPVNETVWPDNAVTAGSPPYPYIPESWLCQDEEDEGDDDDATDEEDEDEVCDDELDNDEDGDVDCDDSDCVEDSNCVVDTNPLGLSANELYIEWSTAGNGYQALELVCGLQGTQHVSLGIVPADWGSANEDNADSFGFVNEISGSLFNVYPGGDYRCTVFMYTSVLEVAFGFADNWSCHGNSSTGMTVPGEFESFWGPDNVQQYGSYVDNWSDGCEWRDIVTGN